MSIYSSPASPNTPIASINTPPASMYNPPVSLYSKTQLGSIQERSTSQCKSMLLSSIPFSSYKSTIHEYKNFLEEFEEKIGVVYQKQCYRIYLNDKTNQKLYQDLIKEKDDLIKALQESKDYTMSANRTLIEEVMRLDKIKSEYDARNSEYQKKIAQKKRQVMTMKNQLKQIQKEIKSYWIYNYDITNVSLNSAVLSNQINRASQSITKTPCSTIKSRHESYYLTNSNSKSQCRPIVMNGQLTRKNQQSHNESIEQVNKENTNIQQNQSEYKKLNESSVLLKQSSLHLPQINHNSTTLISKDLSFITQSATRQKLINKLQSTTKLNFQQKLSYSKEKLLLLKFFCGYLKNQHDPDNNEQYAARIKNDRIVREIEEQIKRKQSIIKQIETLLDGKVL